MTALAIPTTTGQRRLDVLVVDDDLLDRMAVERALRATSLDLTLAHADTAAEAVDLLQARPFDCMLLDFHLPGIDGLAVLQRMRSLHIHTPAIMLTGQGDEQLAVELMKAGAADYLAKQSLSPKRLAKAVLAAVQLKEAEDAARQAHAALQRQNEFAEMLVGIVSHDLRNPVNVILLNAALLERGAPLPPALRPCIERIKRSGHRANKLIADLLDFTQVRLGSGLRVAPVASDLHPIVEQMVEEVHQAYPDRSITVDRRGDGGGVWDPHRIAQVVSNLLLNAVVYGTADTPITVRIEGRADDVQLVVHNWGEPIPDALRDSLFEPLRQGPAAAGQGQGSIGLGLFIVRQIVSAHRGEVHLESSSERGTTFTVRLPRQGPVQAGADGA
ncbi:hybrid sensor histidine kinase/response regulator [Caldimonas brevitalea]|uniref:histidine kinase n=1 Tax=Caldimonas brevitalea TaxID=413882 RepID=A0A0G3BRG5_9BURK|nr:hybrid sensor histidine kinase/response regulator [Caldimonas brevitalea]AKJ29140.1 chemotaxis protein methyltransferase CheR [Caldimonas brevitalea]